MRITQFVVENKIAALNERKCYNPNGRDCNGSPQPGALFLNPTNGYYQVCQYLDHGSKLLESGTIKDMYYFVSGMLTRW